MTQPKTKTSRTEIGERSQARDGKVGLSVVAQGGPGSQAPFLALVSYLSDSSLPSCLTRLVPARTCLLLRCSFISHITMAWDMLPEP